MPQRLSAQPAVMHVAGFSVACKQWACFDIADQITEGSSLCSNHHARHEACEALESACNHTISAADDRSCEVRQALVHLFKLVTD